MSEQYWKDRADALERAFRSYRAAALGFAEAVREDTQTAYPWHPLDEAEKEAHAVLAQQEPDQPADAGEPNTRPTCSHTRLVKDRCPICGPLDDDNRPVTDGDTPAPSAAAIGVRQQISDAQERVAAWPEWMTKSAKVHEPSCCARTREEGLAEAFERAAQDCRGKAADFHALGDDRAVRSFVGLADLYEGFVKKARRTDGDTP
jgi:hypothetical protein